MAKQTKAEKRKAQFTGSLKNLDVPEVGFYNMREKMTNEQVDYAQSILRNKLTFVNAGSGTGKTTIAVASMKYLYDLGVVNKVVYVFSPCQEKALGYRPGNTEEKIAELWKKYTPDATLCGPFASFWGMNNYKPLGPK